MRNNIKISILLSVAIATLNFLSSCTKNNTTSSSTVVSTQCTACDSLRKSIGNDPDLVKAGFVFDSVYRCEVCTNNDPSCINSTACSPRSTYSYTQNIYDLDGAQVLYDKNDRFGRLVNIKQHLKDKPSYLNPVKEYMYYSFDLADTPWIQPILLSFSFVEGGGSYLIPMFCITDEAYIDNYRKYQTGGANLSSRHDAGQLNDTVYMSAVSRQISFAGGVAKGFYVEFASVLSPDREFLYMTADFYSDTKPMIIGSPDKTIHHTLKRYHP